MCCGDLSLDDRFVLTIQTRHACTICNLESIPGKFSNVCSATCILSTLLTRTVHVHVCVAVLPTCELMVCLTSLQSGATCTVGVS